MKEFEIKWGRKYGVKERNVLAYFTEDEERRNVITK